MTTSTKKSTIASKMREWALPTFTVLLALLMVTPLLLGWHSYVVLSGSMESRYPVGSLVYIRPVATSELHAGDVIAFVGAGGVTVTHRVLSVDPDAGQLFTKGDANDTPDPFPVGFANVLGRAVFCLPFAGYLSLLVRSPAVLVLGTIAVGTIAALWFYRRYYPTDPTPRKKEGSL